MRPQQGWVRYTFIILKLVVDTFALDGAPVFLGITVLVAIRGSRLSGCGGEGWVGSITYATTKS